MELDHIFLFVRNEETARRMMADAGLRVNYTRHHPSQGTTNLCACLDDMFFELLWADGSAVSPASQAIGLEARSQGLGSPLGISWRGDAGFDCDPYAAPFLPDGVTIPVARASRDLSLPFMFRTPGGVPPIRRTDGLVGARQVPEFATLAHVEITLPDPEPVGALFAPVPHLSFSAGAPAILASLADAQGAVTGSFRWSAAQLMG